MRARALSISTATVMAFVFAVVALAPAAHAGSKKHDRDNDRHRHRHHQRHDDRRHSSWEWLYWARPFVRLQEQIRDFQAWVAGQGLSFQQQLDEIKKKMAEYNDNTGGGDSGGSTSALSVYDANGQKIGSVAGLEFSVPVVALTAEGKSFGLKVYPTRMVGGTVFFTESDCGGTPYVQVMSWDPANPTSAVALAGLGPAADGTSFRVVYATTPHAMPTTPITARSRFAHPMDGDAPAPCFNFLNGNGTAFVPAALPGVPVMDLSPYQPPYIVK